MKCIKKKLDNGMIVALVPMKHTQLVTAGFFIRAGSRNENDNNHGIAHFLEHMMFGGTEKRSQEKIFQMLDGMGTEYNAVTTTEHTYYYVNGVSSDTKKILDIVLDIYINPVFKPARIKKECKVIIEEMRLRSDTPHTKLYYQMHEKIFAGTSLSKQIIGTEESVSGLTQNDFVRFRKELYVPKNTVFVVCGDFIADQLFPLLDKALMPLCNPSPNSAEAFPITFADEKPRILKSMHKQSKPFVQIERNTGLDQAYVLMAFPIYNLYKTNEQEINMLSNVLSSGFSSRLFTTLRTNNGMTYSSSTYPIVYNDAGLFIIEMTVHPNELVKCIRLTLKELKKMKTSEISLEEYKKVGTIIKNESIFSSSLPIDWFTYYGLNMLYNKNFNPNLKSNDSVTRKISRKDVTDIAQKIFDQKKINLFLFGNIPDEDFDFMKL